MSDLLPIDEIRTKPPSLPVQIPLYDYGFEVLVGIFIFLLVVLIGYQHGGCRKVQHAEQDEKEERHRFDY